jgi:hypothetical protein
MIIIMGKSVPTWNRTEPKKLSVLCIIYFHARPRTKVRITKKYGLEVEATLRAQNSIKLEE